MSIRSECNEFVRVGSATRLVLLAHCADASVLYRSGYYTFPGRKHRQQHRASPKKVLPQAYGKHENEKSDMQELLYCDTATAHGTPTGGSWGSRAKPASPPPLECLEVAARVPD